LLNILAAVFVFGAVILIHEFGHYLLAKANGIGVVEFSIGMGPRLASFVRGGTRYSFKALPFGGSCMMVGEDSEEADPRAFNNKSVWARISVIAAGPGFNFVLAFFAAMIIVAQVGHDGTELTGVMDETPAREAGLMAGDRITKINSRRIYAYRDISTYLMTHPGETVTVRYDRPSGQGTMEHGSVKMTPVYMAEYGGYMLGMQFGSYQKADGIGEFLGYSLYEVWYCITSTFDSFGMMFRGDVRPGEAVAGPIQIVSMVEETVRESRSAGLYAVVYVISNWLLLLSATLGIMNLLPIPALDGGRLLFLFVEVLRGRPMDPEKEGRVHLIGMMVLMVLMVLVVVNDFRRSF